MNAPARLGLFALGLVAVFAAALAVGRYVVPDQSAAPSASSKHGGHGDHSNHGARGDDGEQAPTAFGTTSAAQGYALTELSGPDRVGTPAPLRFTITTDAGPALTRFTTAHEKDLHLIVVRSDGAHFAHLHPSRDAAGQWTVSWTAPAAGSYRVFADFVPGDRSSTEPVVLSSTLQVGGEFTPQRAEPDRTADVDGFTVTLDGELGHNLTATVRRNGQPVALQPYLGARGHLVVLRTGDLAYTHVHPLPGSGADSSVAFAASAPSPGRYLAYLDFQVDGVVRTAAFALDTPAHHGH